MYQNQLKVAEKYYKSCHSQEKSVGRNLGRKRRKLS